jgi:hypothetical protein
MSLPTRADFGGDHPDILCAWREFGGKSLEEAYAHFCSAPESRQEDFMWMGEGAFRFYYPVIDRYLRSLGPIGDDDDWRRPAWILASCIGMHFECHENMSGLHEPIISLCDHVCAHLDHYSQDESEREEIRGAWTELRAQVANDSTGTCKPPRRGA